MGLATAISLGCGTSEETTQSTESDPTQSMFFNSNKNNSADATAILERAKQELAQGKAILLDVRTEGEWNGGHFKSAQHLSLQEIQGGEPAKLMEGKWDPKLKIYTYCAKGIRASIASKLLNDAGFQSEPIQLTFERIHQSGLELDE